jgi:hypothetical protein
VERRPLGLLSSRDRLLAEASIRYILGDEHILEGVPPEKIGEIWIALIYDLSESAGSTDADIDRLLMEAQQNARREAS